MKIDFVIQLHPNHICLFLLTALLLQLSMGPVTAVFHSPCCRIFLSLMEAAGLTDLLKQEGEFTLFAPSDKAFAGLSQTDLTLLKSRSSVLPL